MEININDTFSTVGSRNNSIVPLESRDETLSSMRSNGTTDTVLRSNIIQAEVNSNDTLSTSTREVDINIEPQDNPYATTHTREFYRGRSFRYAGKWKEHVHYLNDDYITDFIEKDGNLLVCKQSNMSSSENEPSEWVYDGDKIVSVVSSYWEVVLVGGLRGKTYLPEYDENSDRLIWRLVQPEDLPESLRTYLGIKDYIDNSLVPIQEDIIDVKSDADVTKRNLSEVEQSVTILGEDLTNLTIISGAISSHVEDLEGNFSDFVQTAEGFFYRVADVEGDLGNLWLTAREFGVQMENVEGDVGRLWLTAQEFGVRMSNTEGDVSQLSIQADEIQTRVENAEGDISQIHQRADEIWTQVENNQGDISRISQRADEISTRVENAEGDISTIRQTADEIATRVENAEGDVSTISQRADQISSQVENIHGDVSRIEQRADQISSRVENMVGDVSLIQQRADEISSQVENINGDVSRITQRADQIQSEVENQQGDISRITQRADLIESQVSNLDGDVSVISQTADEIQSQVTNLEGDISTISQRADEITSRVANVEGDVSTVTQRADLIESQVSSLDGDVSTISQRADEIQSQVENAEGDISRISQRADIIEAQVQNAEGDVSRITQTADQIQSQVENLAGDVSTITQRADLIESQVSNVEGDVSTISQRADEIELRVSNDEGDISQIRQTSNEIALNVSNLEGDVAQLDVKADQISSTVENQQGDISSIIQRADLIEAQVRANKADADGQFVEMSSRITQTAEEIQSEVVANKIDADGKIENANSRITQQAGLIETKVSQTEYDLKTGEIESNVSAIDQKADNINLSVQQVSSRVDQNARDFAKAVNDLQEQIDGAIDTWFYNYAPVHTDAQGVPDSQVPLNVAPYSEWLTAETVEAPEKIRDSHVSDIFYDQDSGYAYRFIGTGDPGSRVYTWIVIQDSAVIKALEDAARAQDTADHKRRVFVANPTVPYDVGDLWVKSTTVGNVSATELYRCTVAKTSAQSADLTNDWAVADSYAKEVSKSNIQILADAIVQQTLTYTYDEYGRLTDDTKSAITTGMNDISLAITGSKLETVGIFIRNANTNDNYINLIADKVRIKGTGNHTPTALGIYWDSTSQSYKISAANLQVEGAFSTTAWTDATTGQRKLVLDDAAAAATGPTGYLTEALYGQDGSASSPTGGVYGTINPMTVALSNFTTITGGLILTTELILGQQSGQSWLPWAGMSGAYDARSQSQGGALGHGIAAWYGGDSVDKASLTTSQIEEGWSNHRWARTLFRMDGSGYLADRKLYWSDQGDLHILGNVTIDGDNYSQTLNEIYNHVITLSSWFVEDTETIPGKTLLRINMGSQQGTGFDGLIFDGFLVTGGDQIVVSGTPGGGSGGAGFLYELGDVLTDSGNTKVKESDGTTNANSGDIFAYNGSKWYALKLGNGLTINTSGSQNVLDAAGTYTLPLAASGTRGGIQIGFTTSAANRNYAVQLSSEKAYVNVPWENTTYTPGTGISISNANAISLTSGVVTAGTYRSVTVDTYGRVTAGTNPMDANNINVVSLATEADITESGVRAYSGAGGTWTGSISSMAYAAILAFGAPNRGWQMWARREPASGMYWRRGNSDSSGWESPRLFLDDVNYSSVLGSVYHPYQGSTSTKLDASTLLAATRLTVGQSSLNTSKVLFVASSSSAGIAFECTADANWVSGISITAPNLTAGHNTSLGHTVAASKWNGGYLQYYYNGSQNADNAVGLGLYDLDYILACHTTGNVGIGYGTTDAGYRLGVSGTFGVTGLATLYGGAEIPASKSLKIGNATISWVTSGSSGYLKIDQALLTEGDQIVNSGTPGGGGSGGAQYLYELNDVNNNLQNPATGTMIYWSGSEWVRTSSSSPSDGNVLQYNNGAWGYVAASSIGGVTSVVGQIGDVTASQIQSAIGLGNYLPLSAGSGKALTDMLYLKAGQYADDGENGALNLQNSNIIKVNSIYTADLSDNSAEGFHFYNTETTVDSLWAANGVLYFTPNRTLGSTGTSYAILHSGNYTSYYPSTRTLTIGGSNYSVYSTGTTAVNLDTTYVRQDPGTAEQTIKSSISSLAKGVINLWRSSGDHYTFLGFSNGTTETYLGGIGFYSQSDTNLYHKTPSSYYKIWDAGNLTLGVSTINAGSAAGRLAYYSATTTIGSYNSSLGDENTPVYLNAGVPTAGKACLKLEGGTMTGDIVMTVGEYIQSPGGYEMCGLSAAGHFYSGPGYEVTGDFRLRSGNANLKHLRYTAASSYTESTIWDSGNSGTGYAWGCTDLTATGTITVPKIRINTKHSSSSKAGGIYQYMNSTDYLLIGYGSSNLWIGANETSGTHIPGNTFISAGGSEDTIYVSWLNNGARSNSKVFHAGNADITTKSWTCSTLDAYGKITVHGTAGVTTDVSLVGSQYTMNFTIGSGNVNRGIWGGTSNKWLLYFNASDTILNFGNVGIGATPSGHKLDVTGTIAARSSVAGCIDIYRTTTGGAWVHYYPANQTTNYWEVGSGSDDYNFIWYWKGSTQVMSLTNAGVLTTVGDQVISSDRTKKTNLVPITLTTEQIANAPAVSFDWKDGHGHSFGSIAQYWKPLVPEAVLGKEGDYTLAYAQLGTVIGINNGKAIFALQKHETEQDKEIRELKDKLFKAENRIKDLENRLRISWYGMGCKY